MQDPKEGINSVQTHRNMIVSVSILAAAEMTLVSTLFNLLTDPQRLQQMASFSSQDPISGGTPLISPAAKLGIALGTLFLSFLTLAACLRIAVHLVGFVLLLVIVHVYTYNCTI